MKTNVQLDSDFSGYNEACNLCGEKGSTFRLSFKDSENSKIVGYVPNSEDDYTDKYYHRKCIGNILIAQITADEERDAHSDQQMIEEDERMQGIEILQALPSERNRNVFSSDFDH